MTQIHLMFARANTVFIEIITRLLLLLMEYNGRNEPRRQRRQLLPNLSFNGLYVWRVAELAKRINHRGCGDGGSTWHHTLYFDCDQNQKLKIRIKYEAISETPNGA